MTEKTPYERRPWLKSYGEGVPASISYEEICLPGILDRTAERFPQNRALIFQGYELTYRQLKEMVARFAACLAAFDVGKGDAVAILLPNMIPSVVAYYAALKAGAVVVMNNSLYTDPELERQFNDSGARVLITLDVLADRMIRLRPKTKIRQIVITSFGDYLSFPQSLFFPLIRLATKRSAGLMNVPDVYRWKDCIAAPVSLPPPAVRFYDVAVYQYTGGTTGISKGVELTHANLSVQAQQCAAWFPVFEKGKGIMLGALPYFHVFGMSVSMNLSVYMGWCQVLIPKPQPKHLLKAIRKFRPTFAPLVPTMYVGMLNDPDLARTDMSCIRGAFSGSAPLPVEVIRDFERLTGAVIVEGYGMTETAPVTHINPFNGGARKVGSIGVPISDTLCRIVDVEDGRTEMNVGEPGELIIRGPQVMRGYKGMAEETANVLRDGWCYTGDIATMDTDGYFTIVGRKKDMIISGGFNIYPRDVEEVFYEHPDVQEACAIGIPDKKRGENVKVFVVLKADGRADADELHGFCCERLAKYKLPTEIEFRGELPKSNVGKILRKQLRAEELEKRGQPFFNSRTMRRT